MNRGSQQHRVRGSCADRPFNEAPIHESGKYERIAAYPAVP